jgi:hypothetical protein
MFVITTTVVALFAFAVAGCAPGKQPNATTDAAAPLSNRDPCATRLHDLSGQLLMFYLVNERLPSALDELATLSPDGAKPDLTCPVSHKPYLYDTVGLIHPITLDRMIVYDPEPSHAGFRWAIAAVEPTTPGGALVTKVIAVRENAILWTLHEPVEK